MQDACFHFKIRQGNKCPFIETKKIKNNKSEKAASGDPRKKNDNDIDNGGPNASNHTHHNEFTFSLQAPTRNF